MKKVIALVFLFLFLIGCSANKGSPAVPTGEVKEFRIEAFQFSYEPSVIEVNRGDTVRIIAKSRDVPHGLKIEEFGVDMQLSPSSETTAEFVADKAGTFTFFCTVPCGPGHPGMQGTLIVR